MCIRDSWTVTYNAENRPVKFESEDGGTTVECAYDSMGRRFEKKAVSYTHLDVYKRQPFNIVYYPQISTISPV